MSQKIRFFVFLSLMALLSFPMFLNLAIANSAGGGLSVGSYFDRVVYQIGSRGVFTIRVQASGTAVDISTLGVTLYFIKTDGTILKTPFFKANYGTDPIYITDNYLHDFDCDIQIPSDSIPSGFFYYIIHCMYKDHAAIRYDLLDTDIYIAGREGRYSYLNNPDYPSYWSLQQDITSLQIDKNMLQTQFNSLQSERNTLQSQVNSIQNQLNTLQLQMNILQNDKNTLQMQVSSLQFENSTLRSQINGLQNDKSSLQIQLNNNNILLLSLTGFVIICLCTTTYFYYHARKIPK